MPLPWCALLLILAAGTAAAAQVTVPCVSDEPGICAVGYGDCQVGASRVLARCREGATRDLALSMLERMCNEPGGAACGALAVEKSEGGSAPRDDAGALALYSKSCDLGDARGCSGAARLIASGRGGSIGRARADSYEQRGCELGLARSCERRDLWRSSERYLALGVGAVQIIWLAVIYFLSNRKVADLRKRCRYKVGTVLAFLVVTWGMTLFYFFNEMMTGRWAIMQLSVSTAICLAFLFLRRLRFSVPAVGNAPGNEQGPAREEEEAP